MDADPPKPHFVASGCRDTEGAILNCVGAGRQAGKPVLHPVQLRGRLEPPWRKGTFVLNSRCRSEEAMRIGAVQPEDPPHRR